MFQNNDVQYKFKNIIPLTQYFPDFSEVKIANLLLIEYKLNELVIVN